MKRKIDYLIRSLANITQKKRCPNCGDSRAETIDRKYVVTSLKKCSKCKLLYRFPVDKEEFNEKYYQQDYAQDGGFTTDLPTSDVICKLIETNFSNTDKSVEKFVNVIKCLYQSTDKLKLVDYGCSWGYMSYQFKKLGWLVDSFEISKPRASFGQKNLNVDIKTDEINLLQENDIFFSSHVIEHHPSISSMIALSKKLLKSDGFFIAECPNGSDAFRQAHISKFHRGWGLNHPNYLSDEFYIELFKNNPYFITTSPYNSLAISSWSQQDQVIDNTGGNQLLIIAKVNQQIK